MKTPAIPIDTNDTRPTRKVAIQIGEYGTYLLLTAEDAAPIIAALTRARFFKKDGYSAESKWKPVDESPEILLVPDSLIEYELAQCVAEATKDAPT